MNTTQEKLNEANESRLRAWRALQSIRKALTLAAALVDGAEGLPPACPSKSFEPEGIILTFALLEMIRILTADAAQLRKAIEGIRPFLLEGKNESAGFPQAWLALNRASGHLGPSEAQVQKFHEALRAAKSACHGIVTDSATPPHNPHG